MNFIILIGSLSFTMPMCMDRNSREVFDGIQRILYRQGNHINELELK
jgi:hypothetical protein